MFPSLMPYLMTVILAASSMQLSSPVTYFIEDGKNVAGFDAGDRELAQMALAATEFPQTRRHSRTTAPQPVGTRPVGRRRDRRRRNSTRSRGTGTRRRTGTTRMSPPERLRRLIRRISPIRSPDIPPRRVARPRLTRTRTLGRTTAGPNPPAHG